MVRLRFRISFYSIKKQSLWHERHFLGMNDIVIAYFYNYFTIFYIFIVTINLSFS